MVVAGMATAFLSRKVRSHVDPSLVQPLRRAHDGDSAWGGDSFLFDGEGRDALGEHVQRHKHASGALSGLLGDLREVLAKVSDQAPIVLAEQPVMTMGETNWKAFDEAVFDVVPMRQDATIEPILLGSEDDFLFEKGDVLGRIVPQSVIAQAEIESGVRF